MPSRLVSPRSNGTIRPTSTACVLLISMHGRIRRLWTSKLCNLTQAASSSSWRISLILINFSATESATLASVTKISSRIESQSSSRKCQSLTGPTLILDPKVHRLSKITSKRFTISLRNLSLTLTNNIISSLRSNHMHLRSSWQRSSTRCTKIKI